MKTTQNTVLITGGSAGIGLALAKTLTEKGNHVIITGRDEKRLNGALTQLKNATGIVSDVSKQKDVDALVTKLEKEHPTLNIVINNAGHAVFHDLAEGTAGYVGAKDEMETNYLSVIRLNERLLPLLKKQTEAAIVNVTSIVAFVPNHKISTYSASKAALHSYSQSLRIALAKDTAVKVFELMPPLVNTDFSQDIGGANGIPPQVVADDLLKALETDSYEIHVGGTAQLYELFLSSPAEALKALNPEKQ